MIKSNQNNDEPLFIPDSQDLKILYNVKLDILLKKYKKGHINSAFESLKYTLYKRYGPKYSIQTFINDANSSFIESDIFSKNLVEYFQLRKWAPNTTKTIFMVIKNLLKNTSISDNFLNRISILKNNKTSLYDTARILKNKYQSLDDEHPVKKRLLEWIEIVRQKSKNKSPSSLKSIISFYTNICLPELNLMLEHWDTSNLNITQETVSNICCNLKYFNWFRLFCQEILKCEFPFDSAFIKTPKENFFSGEYSSGDKHVISTEELEKIYKVTQDSSTLDQLIFMILITTGMRVGGFTKIKLEHVCKIGSSVTILNTGRTLEKGNKWFEFIITDKVKHLLKIWIIKERKGVSEFLFPSSTKTGHISDNTVRAKFKRICDKAGVTGKHVHLHALRHSYAHILLKCGNDISIISKLLNHSNTQTTENFYLKESASEIADRANIPWLNPDNKPDEKIIPDFLQDNTRSELRKKKKEQKIKRLGFVMDRINEI